jgi:hypothetical protein
MRYQLLFTFLLFLPALLIAQDENGYDVSLSGFISSETIYDSRQAVTAREGDVLLFTAPVSNDANGQDLNGTASFNMFSIHSRLRTRVSGPEMWGAQSSALVEMDFVGNANPVMSMMRLRHAILKLEWENTSLMAGQYWHPFFVVSTYPEVAGWGGGIPYAILSRNPQIRFGFNLDENLSGSLTALTQRDFASPGPQGTTPDYLRNAALPELNLHMEYNSRGWTLGFVAGYKEIMPRTQDLLGLKMDETLGAMQGNVFLRKDAGNFTAKVQGMYGENMYNFLMMGGYAEFIDPVTNKITYSNYQTGTLWTDWLYAKGSVTYSLFAGYSENLGTEKASEKPVTINRYGRGNNIDVTYRIAPRLTYKVHKFLVMAEVSYNATAYGTIRDDGTVTDTEEASGVRTHIHLKYNF